MVEQFKTHSTHLTRVLSISFWWIKSVNKFGSIHFLFGSRKKKLSSLTSSSSSFINCPSSNWQGVSLQIRTLMCSHLATAIPINYRWLIFWLAISCYLNEKSHIHTESTLIVQPTISPMLPAWFMRIHYEWFNEWIVSPFKSFRLLIYILLPFM